MSGGTIEGPTVVIGADASRVETALSGLKSQFSSFGSELSGISNGFNLDNVASQFDRVAGGMQKMGAAMSLMGVPMGLLAKESIGMFADLESQIQRNTALLNGGKAEYEQILALSNELGASSPFDALEISKGIESLAAAGYSLQEIQAAMPTITNMAVATGEDLNSMSEILVATLNSYGEAADKAGMYGDKLATIANISSAGVTDFGESIKYVGGVVKAFGVDIDELGAVLGALADVNIKGSSAGTALRSIITDLVSPTKAVNNIFASFGLTMDELNPKTNDFVEILQKMKDAGVSDEALMAAFQERGGPVAIQMINQLDKIKENYNTLQNESAGMLEDFAAQMRDSLKFVMDEMGGTISNIMIEIGEGLKPIVEEIGAWLNENQDTMVEFAKNAVDGLTPFVTKFMDLAKKLMDWFNSLPKDLQSKIAGLTGLGGAMATIGGPLLLLGSLPVSGIAKIAGALKELFSLGNAAGGIAGIAGVTQYLVPIGPAAAGAAGEVGLLSAALAALGGPVVLGAIAGIGIGLAAYTTNFGDFRDNVNSVISELGQAAQNKANDLTQLYGKDVSEQLTTGLATTISKELPKWVSWQKEGKGQSYDDVSKYKSDLWYEFANAVLKSNYAGYSDPGTRDWTFREYINSRLNPDTLKMTEELFTKSLEAYVKPFYDGTLKAEPGKDWLGNPDVQNSSKYYSNDWKFVNEAIDQTGTEAKTTAPELNTLNSALEKVGLTGTGLSNVLSNVDQALSNHRASVLESEDYLSKYNQAAGENTKYTQDQERQTYSLMNSLGMLGTAQDMYNNYMSEGILDATESAHVQEALAAATKMMGDAGVTAQGGIDRLPGALQALASAAQAAMSQIQAAISQAQSAAGAAVSDWKIQTSPTKYPTIAPSSPTNFTVNMNGNTFPAGIKPGDVIRDLTGQLRIVA